MKIYILGDSYLPNVWISIVSPLSISFQIKKQKFSHQFELLNLLINHCTFFLLDDLISKEKNCTCTKFTGISDIVVKKYMFK